VWSALYIGIGVAGWRLYDGASRRTKTLHLAQLALNAAWPIAFFGIRDKRTSLLIIGLLDATVAAEIGAARRDDRIAANLLTPYLAWNVFATALNVAINDPGETLNAST
jgi:benzodiazapine receptor